MKKLITIILILALIGSGGYYLYTRFQTAQAATNSMASVDTVAVEEGNLISTIDATGKVRSKQSATVYWKTSGSVETVTVSEGDSIEAGSILATLAQASLPQNVILAQADLVSAQTTLEDLHTNADNASTKAMNDIATYAKAVRDAQYQLDNYSVPANMADLDTMEALDAMKAQLDAAREAFEPYKYFSSNNTTRQELKEALDQAQSDYNAAVKRLEYEYELQVAQDNLDKARSDYDKWSQGPDPDEIAAAEARIAAAEATLGQAWIEAPFAGIITLAIPQPGDQVNSNTQAFRLDDLATLYVDLQISEIDINLIEVGQGAALTFDAIRGTEYHGVVTEIARAGSETQGVVYFTVTVEMSDPDEDVLPGMTAAVEIIVSQRDKAILIPNQAIRFKEGVQVVYILEPGAQPVPVEIELGISSETYSELLSGNLKVGDQIVLNPDAGDVYNPFSQMGPGNEENRRPGFMGGGGQP